MYVVQPNLRLFLPDLFDSLASELKSMSLPMRILPVLICATNNSTQPLYPCVYLPSHQPPVQLVNFSAQQSPIQYHGAPVMSPALVSHAPALPYAFHTMTLQNSNWNMDTGASSHLANNTDVSVEFDAYGFSVKDYQTGQLLLRCDSTGDLYTGDLYLDHSKQPFPSLKNSSQIPVVLLSFSSTTWHRRLGHPEEDVFRRLE
ncbi:hypothetical protein Tco_0266014 [Tanacetum coccineum]